MPRKKQKGTVDRVEGDVVVILVNDSENPEETKEVYMNKKDFKKKTPKSGDKVSIETE